jgi:hypothetical protein
MSEEEIKKIAKEEFMNNVMEQLDSTLIFTYIQSLENQLQQKENIIKEVREYLDIDESIRKNCKRYDVNGIAILEILDKENK